MKRRSFHLPILGIICALVLSACGGSGVAPPATSSKGIDRPAPPAEYVDMSNPMNGDKAAAEAGKEIFSTNCSSCHGKSGQGDGIAAASLDPKPENLAANQRDLNDAYLFWRISEGGLMDPFNSAMPAWKKVLSEEEIWQVVTYLRSLSY